MTSKIALPSECAIWCKSQNYDHTVLDDMALVDLDWWNERLAEQGIDVRLSGRDLDGAVVTDGRAYICRGDLNGSIAGGAPDDDLTILFRAAAWLMEHPRRRQRRAFPEVMTPARNGMGLDLAGIESALRLCRDNHPRFDTFAPPGSSWGGWPNTPGVGTRLLSLFLWAVHAGSTDRPQVLDDYSVASMCHQGWLEIPSIPNFTRKRYLRYCDQLHAWAGEADVSPELVEMWLLQRWLERVEAAAR
jgi:hypothetical protein